MKKLAEALRRKRLLIADGAWGTMLKDKGLKEGECVESWSLYRREDVFSIADAYAEASADIIETNSFGANRYKLEFYNLADRVSEINTQAAAISRAAAGPGILVLGSVGPSGKFPMMDEVSEPELYDVFKEQVKALENGGVDGIIIESMTDLEEACIAVKAVRENTSCEVVCLMTFDKTAEGTYTTMMGITPKEMTLSLVRAGADVIGANCGTMNELVDITMQIRSVNQEIPIMVLANAGHAEIQEGREIFPDSPSYMAEAAQSLASAGANIIGGCCGTTPLHIKRFTEIFKNWR
jgi:5-methyltetrahydrofolate--homocysteine methyltransferase